MCTECLLNVHWMCTECSLNIHWMGNECSLNVNWVLRSWLTLPSRRPC
jgi:hypothetical protein